MKAILQPYDIAVAAILIITVCLAAFMDIRSGRIPNKLVYPGILILIMLHGFFGPPGALVQSSLGLGATLALFLVPYARGWLGAGDVKLLGLVGAGLGVSAMPSVALFSSLAGGVCAIWVIYRHLLVNEGGVAHWTIFLSYVLGSERKPRICYGVAIAAGTLSAMTWKGISHQYLFALP